MSRLYPCAYCTEDGHCKKFSDKEVVSWCVQGPCQYEKPSNADCIRAMTDEELAEFFLDCVACDDCPVIKSRCKREWANCMDAALSWPQSPAEEFEHVASTIIEEEEEK